MHGQMVLRMLCQPSNGIHQSMQPWPMDCSRARVSLQMTSLSLPRPVHHRDHEPRTTTAAARVGGIWDWDAAESLWALWAEDPAGTRPCFRRGAGTSRFECSTVATSSLPPANRISSLRNGGNYLPPYSL